MLSSTVKSFHKKMTCHFGQTFTIGARSSQRAVSQHMFWRLDACKVDQSEDVISHSPMRDFQRVRGRIDWDDRAATQAMWSLHEKGWRKKVTFRSVDGMGLGVIADEDIPCGTLLRVAETGKNLVQFRSRKDLDSFIDAFGSGTRGSLVRYVADYLGGVLLPNGDTIPILLWPGNVMNHSCEENNVVLVPQVDTGSTGPKLRKIRILTIKDVKRGDVILYDYRIHGNVPDWYAQWVTEHGVESVFPGDNDYVPPLDVLPLAQGGMAL